MQYQRVQNDRVVLLWREVSSWRHVMSSVHAPWNCTMWTMLHSGRSHCVSISCQSCRNWWYYYSCMYASTGHPHGSGHDWPI